MPDNSPAPSPLALWPDGVSDASGDGERPQITPYLLDSATPAPAIVVCPGGGYAMRAAHEAEPIARWLNTLGIAACVLDYRVAPHQHPAPLSDAQRAMRLVRSHAADWRINPAQVGMLGFSAGGHLAATAGTHFNGGNPKATDAVERQGCRPDLLVLCYPVISFGPQGHHGSMVNLLGADPPADLRADLSNETRVTAATPPTFLWHTADDEGVPVANSLLFAQALASHGVPFELHVFAQGRHGLGLALEDPRVGAWTGLCARWLALQGFGHGGQG